MEQTTANLLLVKPSCFSFNPETADSNSFQQKDFYAVGELALKEFNEFNDQLQAENINTVVFDDLAKDKTPDAVFPNNWISMHHNGNVVIYPMQSLLRRKERRNDIIERLSSEYHFQVKEVTDLTAFEKENKFLEGTGSIVFDHPNRIGYMAVSSRSHPDPFNKLMSSMEYRGISFHTSDHNRKPVYHTNVLLSIGNNFVVICSECISDEKERSVLLDELDSSQKVIIDISYEQMASFAGNLLEVKNVKSDEFILLSSTALSAFNSNQKKVLEKFATLLPASIPVIERNGGGSIRCMVAEIFLPGVASGIAVTVSEPQSKQDFEKYYDLRYRILRQPWNQPDGSEKDDQEENSIHFMAWDDKKIIAGVARLQYNNETTAQVRFMAVDHNFQGKGVGKMLMNSIEQRAKKDKRKEIFLQARENALPFYHSLGYTIIEKTFLLFDSIQHFSMRKTI